MKSVARWALVTGAAMAIALTGGSVASAAQQPSAPAPGAAVVTPVLGMFQYGSGSGLPLACSVGVGVITSGADQSPGGSKEIGPLIAQLSDSCTGMATSGHDFFGQAIEQSRALAPVNPVVNPALAAAGDALVRAGTGDAETLAPLGPTIAGTGGLFGFLQGR